MKLDVLGDENVRYRLVKMDKVCRENAIKANGNGSISKIVPNE